MWKLSQFTTTFREFFQRSRLEREMEAELRYHIEARAADLAAGGLTSAEAQRQAKLEFGGLEQMKEECRASWTTSYWDAFRQDMRFAARMLSKEKGYAFVAVLTLALGIGVSTAIFALAHSILGQNAPLRGSGRVAVIWVNNPARGWGRIGPSGRDYLDWKQQSQSFEDLFLFEHGTGTITGDGEPIQAAGLRVTANFADFFGFQPLLGRAFGPAEAASKHNEVLLGYGFWQSRYGADRNVLDRSMRLNGEAYTIIGVLPPNIDTLRALDIVVPFDNDWVRRADSDLGVFGRLKPSVTMTQATAEMNGLMRRIAQERPERRGYGAVLAPLDDVRWEFIRPALELLLGAVALVMLIACANVAHLALGRAFGRQREFAVRTALGASRLRILRQFMSESLLLALLGGCAGTFLAQACVRLIAAYMPATILVPNAADTVTLPAIHLGAEAFALAFLACLAASAVGFFPALQSSRTDVNGTLRAEGRGSSAPPGNQRMRGRLVIAESAIAFILAAGAALMVQSVAHLNSEDLGFRPQHLITLRIKLANDTPDSPYRQRSEQAQVYQRFMKQVSTRPGVDAAALTEIVPMSQDDMHMETFVISEAPPLPAGSSLPADFRAISSGYFHTMDIPLRSGRAFTDQDNADRPPVIMIDETLAKRYFPDQNPLGKHLRIPNAQAVAREIVGVVGGVRDSGLDRQPQPTVYYPYLQSPRQSMSLIVRTTAPAAAVVPAIKGAIWSIDKDQPIFSVRAMDEIVSGTMLARRLALSALSIFAALALALTVIGIYGVTSYAVSQRTHEIGLRLALGARADDVIRLVTGHSLRLVLIGIVIGAAASLVLTRSIQSLLYGVTGNNAGTLLAVALLLALSALLASYVPTRRAVRIDPLTALRRD
jgi:putative ABC transport system permease protein